MGAVKTWFKARFNHRIDTPADRRRSLWYARWADVGFLRHRWTNDGEVTQGVLRANNPTHARFQTYADAGVRTVLNLRNDTHLAPVKLAKERCAQLGLTYVNFPMAPRRAPKRQELLDLIALMPTLEKPVLMHCKSGADRTGLAAAIWLLTQDGAPLHIAQQQLSLRYLHRRDSETGVLDAVLDMFGAAPAGTDFTQWVATTYDPKQAKAVRPKRGFASEAWSIARDLLRYARGGH